MKMQDFLPLTFSPRQVLRGLGGGVAAGLVVNCYFLHTYHQAFQNLWYHGADGVRYLKPDAFMPPFSSLMGVSLYGCLAAALAMFPVAWLFWHSHTLGSMSLYTMRRLPDRWELPRRCFTVPLLALVFFLLLAGVLLLLDLAVYWWCTPSALLPHSPWAVF